jgi:pyridoxamine 5'-phosphate oxidase
VTEEEADAYFASRPRESQIGAWASDQSRPLASRAAFEARYQAAAARFENRDVPRPPHWRGWRVRPRAIEFWNDRAFRLHERRLFVPAEEGGGSGGEGFGWTESLLFP